MRAVEDPALLEYIVEHKLPLEVCPTSNIRLGVFPSYARHTLPWLIQAGANVSISTDTPAVFGISLTDELALLQSEFGLAPNIADGIARNAFEARFADGAVHR